MIVQDETAALRQSRDFLLVHREDYQRAYSGFAWPDLKHFNWALDWFDVIAQGNRRDALRVVSANGVVARRSYAEMSQTSNKIANFLRKIGVRQGDAVMLMLGNVPELWEAMLGIAKLGAVIVPCAPLLSKAELEERAQRAEVKFVIAGANFVSGFASVRDWTGICVGDPSAGWENLADANTESDMFERKTVTLGSDPLLLYFTSGTTAAPKLVCHSHTSYPVGHLSTMYWIGLQPGDVHLNISSPGWAKHAWSSVFAPWLAEATILVLDHPRFNVQATLDTIVSEKVTSFCAPPTVWRMLIQHDLAAWRTNLRELVGAGEPLNQEVIGQVRKAWGLTIRDGYGQTESSAMIGNTPGQNLVIGTVGRPLPGFSIVLKDADGADVIEGEVCVRLQALAPVGLMQGYRMAGGQLKPLAGDVYRAGDIASCDDNGIYTYVGRADDVFKASDYRISPFELESVLIEHPAIAEAAVVPSPDPVRLAVPKAFVTLVSGAVADAETARSVMAHARAALGPFKRIRRIEFLDLPKTFSGKIRRNDLRALEARQRAENIPGRLEWTEEDFN